MYHWFVLVAVILAVLFGLAIGVLNPAELDFNLVFVSWQTTAGMLFTIALIAGVLIGVISIWVVRVLPLQYQLRKLKRHSNAAASPATDVTVSSSKIDT
ncbi:MAG: DUF1049 domain-containing protein [Gammaproteobacteria bacterium]|nr:DUF1049 domain-containing protein [Gammaproteobacteria bacterium]